MDLMHKLAKISENERRHLISEFLNATFGGIPATPEFAVVIAGVMRSMTPNCPTTPRPARSRHGWSWPNCPRTRTSAPACGAWPRTRQTSTPNVTTKTPCRDFIASVRNQAGPALETGIGPVSPQADPIVAALTDHYAHISGFPDDADLRPRLAARLETVNDPRRERYLQLLAAINGWSAPDSLTPVLDWSIQAVRARIQR
jgi:hypothetical protein